MRRSSAEFRGLAPLSLKIKISNFNVTCKIPRKAPPPPLSPPLPPNRACRTKHKFILLALYL